MVDGNHLKSLKKIKSNLYGNLKNKQRNGFVDCCEKYKFIRDSNTISFNNKMNILGITHLVLDEDYNQIDLLMHDITIPIKYGAPIIIGIVGYTRSGKSEAAQLFYFIIKQANKKYKNRDIELFLCWTQPSFKSNLKLLKKGDVMWTDEQPKTTGKGSRTETWQIENVMHSIAKRENGFLFVTPKLKNIKTDICDLYLETAGQDRKTNTNRFMILDDERRYFGHVYLKLHEEQEFRDWYEKEKDKFIDDISENPTISAFSNNVEIEFDLEDDNYDLESIRYIKAYLKQNDNEITIKEYAYILEKKDNVARRILDNFVDDKKLKCKKIAKGKHVYFK